MEHLTEHLNSLTDVSVVGVQLDDEVLEIYATARKIKGINSVKCEFALEHNYL